MSMQRFDVEVPDGHHLGYSRGTDGARRAHLFRNDTNELAGHAELFEVAEDRWCPTMANYGYDRVAPRVRAAERNPEVVAMIDAFFEWLTPYAEAAAGRAGERLRNWWLNAAVPVCKSTARATWSKVTDRRKADPRAEMPKAAALVAAESVRCSNEVAGGVHADMLAMRSHEVSARRMAALLGANPSLLAEFVKVFPAVDPQNGQPATALEQGDPPTLRLVAG